MAALGASIQSYAYANLLQQPLSQKPIYFPEFDSQDIELLVGIRPFRTTGLCIEKSNENFSDDFRVYKNYGHGGAGWTLCWGSAELVADIVDEQEEQKPIAVIGAGIIGLTTAYELILRGYEVTIYSDQFSSFSDQGESDHKMTSDVAGGQWTPSFVNNGNNPTALAEGLLRSYFRFNNLDYAKFKKTGQTIDIDTSDSYYLNEDLFPVEHLKNIFFNADENKFGLSSKKKIPKVLDQFLKPQKINLQELPFFINKGSINKEKPMMAYDSFMIDIPIYINNLMKQLIQMGARLQTIKPVNDISELKNTINESAAVCCLGYGSKKLFNDDKMVAVRGQLVLIKGESRRKNKHINYCQSGVGYMFPREDAIILGGTYDRNETELNLPKITYKRIYDKHLSAFS